MANKSIEARIRELPQDLLNRGFQLAGAGRDVWLAGLGAVATAEEQGGTLLNDLIERGQKLEQEGRSKVSEFKISDLPKELRNLPQEVFNRSTEMVGKSRDVWLAGLGAMTAAQEEGGSLFNTLVERGQKLENRGMQQVGAVREELSTRQHEIQREVSDRVEVASEPLLNALKRFGVPTRAEVRDLAASVDALAKKVDSLLTRLEQEPARAETAQAEPAAPAESAARAETATAREAVFSVVARGDEGWALRKEGRQSDISTHATKEEALEEARTYAAERAPSRLEVYKKDGSLQDTIAYGA
jgi:poly(hydroxyalkanoate) granule-associated protein